MHIVYVVYHKDRGQQETHTYALVFDSFGSVCPSAGPSACFKRLLMIPLTRYYRDQGELVSVISSRSLLPWSVGEIFS